MKIEEICTQSECGHIEYKREWYWDLDDNDTDKVKLWGEFIKDSLALINANVVSFNKPRYMIIGFDEITETFFDFGLTEQSFEKLRKKINVKLNSSISDFEYIDFRIDLQIVNNISVIVLEIKQPTRIHSLKRNIQTGTTDYKENTVLYRFSKNSSRKDDSVGVMPISHIKKIESKLKDLYGSDFTPIESYKNKSIKDTVSSYIKINSSLHLSKDFPKKIRNGKGYAELYELENSLDKSKTYFAYINDSNMKLSIEGLNQLFTENVGRGESLILLVDKPRLIEKSTESRLAYIKRVSEKNALPVTKLDFIENFGKEYLYKQYLEPLAFDHNLPNTQNFIESYSYNSAIFNDTVLATDLLKDWFIEQNSPLIVLTGSGGVGKTTIVKHFLNTQLKKLRKDTDHYVLFLDSSSLLERLRSDRVSSIYDLYTAISDDSNFFTEELFKLSIDNGSFIIVLDGLDEIISGINIEFKLQDFLNNIYEDYCFNLAETKIILTCRDYIWDEAIDLIPEDFPIKQVHVQPFSIKQTKEFFASCFKDNPKLQNKSMKLVKDLVNKSNETYYNPFMLETVSDLIKEGTNSENINDIFEIEDIEAERICLIKNSMLDYLIYAVCKREEKKIGIDITEQIKILCRLSELHENIDKHRFSLIVNDIIPNTDQTIITQLLAHTFMDFDNVSRSIKIEYDFLKDFFLKISTAQHILNEDILDTDLLSLLLPKVSYLNQFSLEVGKRLYNLDPDNLQLFILSNIENIEELIEVSEDKKEKNEFRCYISNIFILYLGVLKSKQLLENSADVNKALNDIFSSNAKELDNLYLYNIRDISSSPKLIFNFCDKKVNNCYIYNYSGFTECEFNENTLFDTGSVHFEAPSSSSSLDPMNFSKKIIKLENTSDVLEQISYSSSLNSKQSSQELKRFIKTFIKNMRFVPKKAEEVKNKRGGDTVKKMLDIGIIILHQESKLNQKEYIINPELSNELQKFWDSGVMTPKLKKII